MKKKCKSKLMKTRYQSQRKTNEKFYLKMNKRKNLFTVTSKKKEETENLSISNGKKIGHKEI